MEIDNQPLVSVVTPFHNAVEYLEECIESVLAQTYNNLEYILVDNFSSDGSLQIAKTYTDKNPKVRVLRTKKFLSQVQNYNFALSCISHKSQYCKMVQADDWLFPQCLEQMVSIAEKRSKIGFVSSYVIRGTAVCPAGLDYRCRIMSGRDTCRMYFIKNAYLFGTPTTYLIRSDLIRSRIHFFNEASEPFEDADVCFELLQTWDFAFVHQILSYSRKDENSIVGSMQAFNWEESFRLVSVVKWSPSYLNTQEVKDCLKNAEKKYATAIVEGLIHLRGKSFWDFHRKIQGNFGYRLNRRLFAKTLIAVIFDRIGNPKKTLQGLLARADKNS